MLALCVATPAVARQSASTPQTSGERPDVTIDATKLGVSLSRIEKGLRTEAATAARSGSPLRLAFQVQVFGTAPRIDIFKDVDLMNGEVPGAAPSHQQMIDFWTPRAFAAPSMPVLAMAVWAAQQLLKKSRKTQCEEDLAQYRALLMQGVNVSAPRCAR